MLQPPQLHWHLLMSIGIYAPTPTSLKPSSKHIYLCSYIGFIDIFQQASEFMLWPRFWRYFQKASKFMFGLDFNNTLSGHLKLIKFRLCHLLVLWLTSFCSFALISLALILSNTKIQKYRERRVYRDANL